MIQASIRTALAIEMEAPESWLEKGKRGQAMRARILEWLYIANI